MLKIILITKNIKGKSYTWRTSIRILDLDRSIDWRMGKAEWLNPAFTSMKLVENKIFQDRYKCED